MIVAEVSRHIHCVAMTSHSRFSTLSLLSSVSHGSVKVLKENSPKGICVPRPTPYTVHCITYSVILNLHSAEGVCVHDPTEKRED